jgi:hypothetical protein
MFMLLRTMNGNKCGSASLYVQSSVRVAIIIVPVCSPVVTFTLLRVVFQKKVWLSLLECAMAHRAIAAATICRSEAGGVARHSKEEGEHVIQSAWDLPFRGLVLSGTCTAAPCTFPILKVGGSFKVYGSEGSTSDDDLVEKLDELEREAEIAFQHELDAAYEQERLEEAEIAFQQELDAAYEQETLKEQELASVNPVQESDASDDETTSGSMWEESDAASGAVPSGGIKQATSKARAPNPGQDSDAAYGGAASGGMIRATSNAKTASPRLFLGNGSRKDQPKRQSGGSFKRYGSEGPALSCVQLRRWIPKVGGAFNPYGSEGPTPGEARAEGLENDAGSAINLRGVNTSKAASASGRPVSWIRPKALPARYREYKPTLRLVPKSGTSSASLLVPKAAFAAYREAIGTSSASSSTAIQRPCCSCQGQVMLDEDERVCRLCQGRLHTKCANSGLCQQCAEDDIPSFASEYTQPEGHESTEEEELEDFEEGEPFVLEERIGRGLAEEEVLSDEEEYEDVEEEVLSDEEESEDVEHTDIVQSDDPERVEQVEYREMHSDEFYVWLNKQP